MDHHHSHDWDCGGQKWWGLANLAPDSGGVHGGWGLVGRVMVCDVHVPWCDVRHGV